MPANHLDEFEWLRARADDKRAGGDYGLAALYDELAARLLDMAPDTLTRALVQGLAALAMVRR